MTPPVIRGLGDKLHIQHTHPADTPPVVDPSRDSLHELVGLRLTGLFAIEAPVPKAGPEQPGTASLSHAAAKRYGAGTPRQGSTCISAKLVSTTPCIRTLGDQPRCWLFGQTRS